MIVATAHNFDQWRESARRFLASDLSPDQIVWHEARSEQANLFNDDALPLAAPTKLHIPPDILNLMARIACHRDESRWTLLYQAMWRLKRGERHLYNKATDPLIHRLRQMDNEIRRDAHKTKAFVRFRSVHGEGGEHFVAWHRPDHRVLSLVAPFFQRRFSVMAWSILTPDESVAWDGRCLQTGPGVPQGAISADSTEELWLAYYSATFNPARIKIKMMKREMPVRHWPTLPEAALIPKLLADAPKRVEDMIARTEGTRTSAEAFLPVDRSFASLKDASLTCKGCDLHCSATQTVFGEGAEHASIMLVGEQPGDQEDLAGKAFVGPAGQILNDILARSQLSRESLYITNTVKHFKFSMTGKRRIHKSPAAQEINACKPWLFAEVDLIKPRVIVTLGLTAARALVHQGFSLKHDGIKIHAFRGVPVIATWHPSAILRAPDEAIKSSIMAHIQKALVGAKDLCDFR